MQSNQINRAISVGGVSTAAERELIHKREPKHQLLLLLRFSTCFPIPSHNSCDFCGWMPLVEVSQRMMALCAEREGRPNQTVEKTVIFSETLK